MADLNGGSTISELDLAWERFHAVSHVWGGGFSNHGPMAVEALGALGHASLIPGFVERYAPRLPPAGPGEFADRRDAFEVELAGRRWRDVVAEQVPPLLPGAFAAAGHGLLRTAHAVRALEAQETPIRTRELAHGLAVWATGFQELPGTPGAAPQPGAACLADLAPVPEAKRSGVAFTEQVRALDAHPAYEAWVAALDLSAEPAASLDALIREAAALYLDHPHARIAYCHAITVPAAVRLLAPLLPEAAVREAVGRAYQAAGALHAVMYSPCDPERVDAASRAERDEAIRMASVPEETRYRAACSLDDHAIKLAEACLREDARAPSEVLRIAAADAALHMGGPQRSC